MNIGKKGLALIKEFEGYHTRLSDGRCTAYLDRVANPPIWTIGYGCTEPRGSIYNGLIWTQEEAEKALLREIRVHEREVERVIRVPMNQNQFDALVSFSYNYGIGRAHTLIRHVNNNDWQSAGNCLPAYGVVKGVPVNGLIRRRKAERDLMWTLPPKEVVDSSTKLGVAKSVRNFLVGLLPAGGVAEVFGFLDYVKNFATDHWLTLLLVTGLSVWLLLKWFEWKSVKDHEDGRYEPSKAKEFVEETINVDDPSELDHVPKVPGVAQPDAAPSVADPSVDAADKPQ